MTSSAESAGDVLLLRGAGPDGLPVRHAGGRWRDLVRVDGWTLRAHEPGPGWTALPLREREIGGRRAWLFGETWSPPEEWDRVVAGASDGRGLAGQFLGWVWDPESRTWSLWTDRFGTLHAYHARAGDVAAVGTFHPAVAAAVGAEALDWEGLAGFLGTGYFPGDRTPYAEVRIARPAAETRFTAGAAPASRRWWSWDHAPEDRPAGEFVDELAGRLAEVVADHVRGLRAAIPVSGGLDSRCLVAAAPAEADVWTLSYGYGGGSVETSIARRVAAARGRPFDAFEVPAYLRGGMDQVLACVEGFQDVTQSRQLGVAGELAARSDVVLGGHWGDVWLDTLGLAGERDAGPDRVRDRALELTWKPAGWLDDHVVRPSLGRDPVAARREMVEEEMVPYDGIADPDFRLKAFKTDHWSFRWTLASVRAYRAAARPRLPFYDPRVTDLFLRVPSRLLADRGLQVAYLRRHAPDLARIRWQASGASLLAGPFAALGVRLRRAAGKAKRVALRKVVLQRNWEVQFAGPAGRSFLESRLLERGIALHDHVDPAAVVDLLAELRARPHDGPLGYQVSMLLSFAAWLEWSARIRRAA